MDGVPQIEDPCEMKKEQIGRLLEHWRRPVSGSELFRFSHVLVNNKSDETMAASYTDSYAAVLSHPQNVAAVDEHDTLDAGDNFLGVDSTTPTPVSLPIGVPTRNTNPATPPTPPQFPTSNSFTGVPTRNPTPFDDSNILQDYAPLPPGAPTPVISTNEPEQSRPPRSSLTLNPMSNVTLGSVDSQSRPRPKQRKTVPTIAFQDPTIQQEEELGRPKRVQKRKLDIYLEAEQKTADLAEKKKHGGAKRKK
jgi:hypothetical protein